MEKSITLRSYLAGEINDLAETASLGEIGKSSIVCELVSLVSGYRNEGTVLFLDLFLTESISKFIRVMPESAFVKLGMVPCEEEGVIAAVKKAAPLARGCWKIYFCPNGAEIEYGVFRDSGHPLNVPLTQMVQHVGEEGADEVKFIRVTKLGHDSVSVSTHKSKEVIFYFNNAKAEVSYSSKLVSELCDVIALDIEPTKRPSFLTFLNSLLSKAIRESHGALIAVVQGDVLPTFLSDRVEINPSIDLSEAVENVLQNPKSVPQLYSFENLICGMFCCDGIVVFNTTGKVLAYSAFVRHEGVATVSGGARKRAFDALASKVGSELKAAFYQSQDGPNRLKK